MTMTMRKTTKTKKPLTDAELMARELRGIRMELRTIATALTEMRCLIDEDCGYDPKDDESLLQ